MACRPENIFGYGRGAETPRQCFRGVRVALGCIRLRLPRRQYSVGKGTAQRNLGTISTAAALGRHGPGSRPENVTESTYCFAAATNNITVMFE